MLSMGLKSRSSILSTAVTNNAVELVTATKGLGVRTLLLVLFHDKDDPISNSVIYCYEVSVDLGALNSSRWRRE